MITGQINKSYSHQLGLSLIEVLVALFIMVTGILGAVAMQASAKKGSFDAMQRSIASALAQDILERMRSNDATILESYEGTYGDGSQAVPAVSCNLSTALCTPAQRVIYDRYQWEQNLIGTNIKSGTSNVGGLIDPVACIQHTNNNVIVVISWQGRELTADGAANNASFAQSCGTANKKRRQVVINGFIY